MTFLGPQFLYVADAYGAATELINGARTTTAMTQCTPFSSPLPNAGCDVLTLQPCTTAVVGPNLVRTAWQPTNFAPTAAPWYRASVPASTEALGFIIEEFTGLDGAHRNRSMVPVGSLRGGATAGPLGSRHRIMKLNVLLHGTSERGLQYLFGWLEQRLMDCCNPCGGRPIWYRESCPSLGSPADGLRMLRDVVLVEGPTLEAPPTQASGCSIRRVSFTLAAGDPCSYSPITDLVDGVSSTSGVSLSTEKSVAGRTHWVGTSRRVTSLLPMPQVGRMAPIVTISSAREYTTGGALRALPDLRISGYVNPTGAAFNPSANNLLLGEVLIGGTNSSGLVIEVDLAARQVRYRDPSGDNSWYDGSRFISPQFGGVRRWWNSDGCHPAHVVVEPLFVGLASRYSTVAQPVSSWSVDVAAVEFHGCC